MQLLQQQLKFNLCSSRCCMWVHACVANRETILCTGSCLQQLLQHHVLLLPLLLLLLTQWLQYFACTASLECTTPFACSCLKAAMKASP